METRIIVRCLYALYSNLNIPANVFAVGMLFVHTTLQNVERFRAHMNSEAMASRARIYIGSPARKTRRGSGPRPAKPKEMPIAHGTFSDVSFVFCVVGPRGLSVSDLSQDFSAQNATVFPPLRYVLCVKMLPVRLKEL